MSQIVEWLRSNDVMLWWMVILSIITFVGTLIAVPWLIIRLPADYFATRRRRTTPFRSAHPAIRLTLIVVKNIIGGLFFAAGLAMLVLPGQGILTMVIGLSLIDFPGKFTVERWVVRRRSVLGAMNWIRRKAGQGPLARPSLRE